MSDNIFTERHVESAATGVAVHEGQLSDWRARLDGAPPSLEVPANRSQGTYVVDLIGEHVRKAPTKCAIRHEGRQITYGELERRSDWLAHHLRGITGPTETVVGIALPRGIEFAIAILATWKAGAIYLPLDTTHHPQNRINDLISQTHCDIILANRAQMADLGSRWPDCTIIDVGVAGFAEAVSRAPVKLMGDQLAYVIFTSGSTGQPKGAMISHAGMANHILGKIADLNISATDVVAQTAPSSFDISIWQLFAPLSAGGTCVIYSEETCSQPRSLLKALAVDAVTIYQPVPSTLRILVSDPTLVEIRQEFRLRCLVPTGEALPPSLCGEWLGVLPEVPLVNAWGATEVADDATHFWVRRETSPQEPIPIGCPLANYYVYVLDAAFNPVPVGVKGELHIGGIGVGRGYWEQPGLTAERFIPNPFGDGDRLYRTGDLGLWRADGNLEFGGRADHQVKIRGFRVELGEVEHALSRVAYIAEAAVTTQDEPSGDKRLVAYIVTQDGAVDAASLRAELRRNLPDYMVPSAFVVLDRLPLTPSGKVDRKRLQRLAHRSAIVDVDRVGPQNHTEALLAAIWADVLGRETVGSNENFFDMGGHSLLGMRLISKIRTAFGIEIPLKSLFEMPTIAELAHRIAEKRADKLTINIPPLTACADDGLVSLSLSQERLWFLDRLFPNLANYNILYALRLRGNLDAAAMARSLSDLVARHESLRTRFVVVDGEAYQKIDPPIEIGFAVVDLTALDRVAKEAEAHRLATEELRRPFDLQKGPLLRAGLLKLADDDHVLLLPHHHIISDGWSLQLLSRELSALYRHHVLGEPLALPELPVQYRDYSVWQRRWLQGPLLEKQLSYWRANLEGAPAELELPTDRPRPAIQSFRGGMQALSLPTTLSQRLVALSREENVTLFMTLMAAFQLLLGRYARSEDIVTGTLIAGRTVPEIENLIGFFPNTVVIRTSLTGHPTFRELLQRVREATLGAYAHQDLPFEKLVDALHRDRELSRNPIFQVMFALQNAADELPSLPGITVSPASYERGGAARFDLYLSITETAQGLLAELGYASDLFDAPSISRMLDSYRSLLEDVVAAPDSVISSLNIVSQEERIRLLGDWNDTARDYPDRACVHELISAQASRTPNNIAVRSRLGELTYQELDQRSNRMARLLQSYGVGPEVVVGVCAERSVEYIVGVIAVFKAGGVYLPLDRTHPADRRAYMISITRTSLLLCDGVLDVPYGATRIDLKADASSLAIYSAGPLPPTATPGNLAYLIFTSGSTGRPKAVMGHHRGLVNRIAGQNAILPLGAADVVLQKSTVSFVDSLFEMLGVLCTGGVLSIVDHSTARDAALLTKVMVGESATRLVAVPSLMREIVSCIGDSSERRPTSIQAIHLSGESVSGHLVTAIRELLPECRIFNLYGTSEIAADATVFEAARAVSGVVPIGRPLPNCLAYVLDGSLNLVPVGAPGELYIGGAGVSRGYWERPDLTAERFIPNLFGCGDRLYRTGDLVRWRADGNLDFLGRIDQQVKVGGARVELSEVEHALLSIAAVGEALVTTEEDTLDGKRLVAYVVAKSTDIDVAELRTVLRRSLPEYMIPSQFMVVERFPLTPSGKVDRAQLPHLKSAAGATNVAYAEPASPIEEILAEIWVDLLQRESVGINENFFDLGGYSLLGMRLMSRIRAMFGVELPLINLFEAPTIRELSQRIEGGLQNFR